MTYQPVKVLIIGTLPPPVGGAGVSLQHLISELSRRDDVRTIVVNTGGVRGRPFTGPFRFAAILFRIFAAARRVDVVSLQPAPSGLPFVGPFVWASARLWRKPFMIRMFGGQDYRDLPGVRGAIVRWLVRRSDLYLAQTKALVASARADHLQRVEWFATSRPMRPLDDLASQPGRKCRRFVFLSHVKKSKGIEELIEASEHLDDGAQVDVYGPFMEGVSEQSFRGRSRICYRGEVPAGEADAVLRQYDAVVFPTYWPGEGYPGIILEAYGAGIPVITTRWMSIPEIVDDSCGILVEPKDSNVLADAMKRLSRDDVLYARLCQGARAKRDFFNADRWVDCFVDLCRGLVEPAASRSVL